MLNLMERYNLEERDGVNSHRMVEALKFGFASRLEVFSLLTENEGLDRVQSTKVCDPTFVNDTKRIDEISTKAFADIIVRNITDVSTNVIVGLIGFSEDGGFLGSDSYPR